MFAAHRILDQTAGRLRFVAAVVVVAGATTVGLAGGGTAAADGLTSTQHAEVPCGPSVDTFEVTWSITNVSASAYDIRVVWSGSQTLTLQDATLNAGASASGLLVVVAAPHPVVRFEKSTDHFGTFEEVDVSPTPPAFCGYQFATASGAVFDFRLNGGLSTQTQPMQLNQPVVAIASTPDRHGYWLVAADGGVFAFGSAKFSGSTGNLRLNRPVTGMAVTPTGAGYWLVAADGGVFAFGDAKFYGSGPIAAGASVVGITSTPLGRGYWLAGTDGEVLAFGDAAPHGAIAGITLRSPITAIASTPDGGGYWLAASDGGVFTFGDARYSGSAASLPLNQPIVGMLATPDGSGYWLVASDGGVFSYGGATFGGSTGHWTRNQPTVVGMIVAR